MITIVSVDKREEWRGMGREKSRKYVEKFKETDPGWKRRKSWREKERWYRGGVGTDVGVRANDRTTTPWEISVLWLAEKSTLAFHWREKLPRSPRDSALIVLSKPSITLFQRPPLLSLLEYSVTYRVSRETPSSFTYGHRDSCPTIISRPWNV